MSNSIKPTPPELGDFDRVAHEWHGHDKVKIHFIKMPTSHKDSKFYTGNVSADAFRFRQAKRHYEASQKGVVLPIRFYMVLADEYKSDLASWSALSVDFKPTKEIPFQVHENLWNFYELINWDYKNKKLVTDEPKIKSIKKQSK